MHLNLCLLYHAQNPGRRHKKLVTSAAGEQDYVTQAAEGIPLCRPLCLLNFLACGSFSFLKYSHDENTGSIESVHLRGRQET